MGTGWPLAKVAALALAATVAGGCAAQENAPQPSATDPIRCGQPLPAPMSVSAGPVFISVNRLERLGPPATIRVEVMLSASSPVETTQPAEVPLQLALLRDGVVVDRLATYRMSPEWQPYDQIAFLDGDTRGAIGVTWTVTPQEPYRVVVEGPGRCDGFDWSVAWSAPAQFELAAFMSTPSGSAQPVTSGGLLGVAIRLDRL
ncbi:hypothetical protein [Micromonospora marina]|uniref:hypothetical protein n=1 Tax=Micromonospora marina TaxID=307120 RepID=UPI003453545E